MDQKLMNLFGIFLYVLSVFFLCALASFSHCNPSSVTTPANLCDGLHPFKPVFSDICHGADFRFPFYRCSEAQCHGTDLKGGNSGAPSCYKCHGDRWTIFSTTHTYKVSGFYHHSDVNLGNFTVNCGDVNCHGPGLIGVTDAGYSCYACHNPIPPPGHTVKLEGAKHHYNYCLLPHLTYCGTLACHGDDSNLDNGTGTPCSNCHSPNRTCD